MSHFNVIYPLCYLNRYTVNKNFTIKLNRWACLIIIAIPEFRGDFLSWVMLSYKIHLPLTFKTAHGYLSRPGSARGLFPLRASFSPPLLPHACIQGFIIGSLHYNISVAECAFACSLVPNGSPQWMDPHVDLAKILRRMPFHLSRFWTRITLVCLTDWVCLSSWSQTWELHHAMEISYIQL